MENKATLSNQKRERMTLLHYAMGTMTDKDKSKSVIRKSLGSNKPKNKPSKAVR